MSSRERQYRSPSMGTIGFEKLLLRGKVNSENAEADTDPTKGDRCCSGKVDEGVKSKKKISPIVAQHRFPDRDSFTMYMGRIPKTVTESTLRQLFERHGEIYRFVMKRDRSTGEHCGACFVTYFTREAALSGQKALDGVSLDPGMNTVVRFQLADRETKPGKKVFVDGLHEDVSKDVLSAMFSFFGDIQQSNVVQRRGMRSAYGFVTFVEERDAKYAIRCMNGFVHGPSGPLTVNTAHEGTDKQRPTGQSWMEFPGNFHPSPHLLTGTPLFQQPLMHLAPNYIGRLAQMPPNDVELRAGDRGHAWRQSAFLPSAPTNMASAAKAVPPNASNAPYFSVNGQRCFNHDPRSTIQDMQQSFGGHWNRMCFDPWAVYGSNWTNLKCDGSQKRMTARREVKLQGPEGANLFLTNLPRRITVEKLKSLFSPYGNVIDAEVFCGRVRKGNKRQAFLSYDDPKSAHVAIQYLHGSRIGDKHVQVELIEYLAV